MADIRINALATTATTPASDDYLALDGTAQGTRKILATNIANNVTDVILGTSGPSVKSTLSARAPRQGLVFDSSHGTTYATVANIPAFGQGVAGSTRGDFTFAAWVREESSFAGTPIVVIGNGAGGFYCEFNSSGIPYVGVQGGSTLYSTTACVVGRTYLLTYTRTGNTGTWYIDGVSTNSLTDGINYTLPFANVSFASPYGLHGFCYPLAYNRCLSATEVKALYEAGAPAGADYNSASNTAFNTSNFVEAIAYTTFTGVSATGFSATQTGAVTSLVVTKPNITINAGNRVLVTFTGTLTSGAVPNVALVTSANGVASNISAVAAGSNSVVLTATAPCVGVGFYTTGAATSYAISNVVATRQGLLLAPDAAQAGGGLVWYDTSGNAANITLPASGVSWNVPFAGYLTAPTTTNLTLNGGSSGGSLVLAQGSSDATALTANVSLYLQKAAASAIVFRNNAAGSYTEAMRIAGTTGNFLINTTTDGGQKLQVSGTAYVSGDFTSGSNLRSSGATNTIRVRGNSQYIDFTNLAENAYVNGIIIANTLNLYGNNGTGLSIGATGDATFAGAVQITTNASSVSRKLVIFDSSSANNTQGIEFSNTTIGSSGSSAYIRAIRTSSSGSNTDLTFGTMLSGVVSEVLKLDSSQNATFAGSIRQNQANNISLTSGVATTIFSLGTSAGVYIVTATLDVNGNSGYAIVGKGATGNWQVLANSGSQISFSMSTNDLQITQSSGSTSTTNTFNLLRLR